MWIEFYDFLAEVEQKKVYGTLLFLLSNSHSNETYLLEGAPNFRITVTLNVIFIDVNN